MTSRESQVELPDPPTMAFEQIVSQAMRVAVGVCVPGILIFVVVETALGRATWALGAYVASQLLIVVAHVVTQRRSYRLRAMVLAVYALLVVLFSMLHYGPNIGTGVVVVAAAFWAGMVLHFRGAIAVAVAVAAIIVFVGLMIDRGWLEPASPVTGDVLSVANWVRFVTTVPLCALGLGWVVGRVVGELESALEGARAVFFEREVERERRADAERDLERAQRLNALGRLAGGVGHDINNALAVVLVNAESLAERRDPEQRELAEEIIAAVLTARETTQRLAALGEAPAAVGEHVRIDDAVSSVLRSVERLCGPAMRIQSELEAACEVAASSERVERILLNLCLNARDAMPDGGEARVSTRRKGDDWVELVVQDTGTGMTRDVRDQMFDPFFTTRKAGEGTGLGLTTVYQLVTSAGGHVDVSTEPGHGTAFIVELPVHRRSASEAQATPVVSAERQAPLRVCVVEDDPSVRRVIVRVLRRAGHTVVQAETGDEALDRVADSEGLDVLLTDAGLPGASVGDVIAAFRRHHPEGAVLVVSGHEEGRLPGREAGWGDHVFLRKPFSSDELLAALAT